MSDTLQVKSLKAKTQELGRHFLIYGLGSVLQGLVTFILLPVLSHYFSVADYGKYSIILLIGTLFGSFFYLGGQTAITRFYFDKNSNDYQSKVVTNTTLIMIIGAFLCFLSGIISSAFISKLIFDENSYWKVISISTMSASLGIINTYLITYLRIIRKSLLFVLANFFNLIINVTATIIFLKYSIFHDSLFAPFMGMILGLSFSVLFSVYPAYKMLNLSNIDFSEIRIQLKFSFPIVLMGLIFYLFEWSDRLVIEKMLTLSDVGIYSFGYKIGTIINLMFVVPFGLIFSVLRMEYAQDKTVNVFFSRIATYYTIIGLSIVITLVIFTKFIISIAASTSEYTDAYKVTPWILLGQFILGYAGIFDFGIYYAKKTYYYVIIYGLVLGFNISLNLLFLDKFGYQFAALNKTVSYTILILLLFFISRKYYCIVLEKRFFKLILSALLALIIIQIINSYNYNFTFIIIVVSILLFYWYHSIINSEEKAIIKKYQSQFIQKGKSFLNKKLN